MYQGHVYEKLKAFKKAYPATLAWRLKAHAKVIEKHLNPGEEITYAFAAQKGYNSMDFFSTFAIVLTNKRILLAQKRLVFGYIFLAVTPDMFNDLTVSSGLIWGKVTIDTIKETMLLSNISKNAVAEIETQITEYMMEEKRKCGKLKSEEDR